MTVPSGTPLSPAWPAVWTAELLARQEPRPPPVRAVLFGLALFLALLAVTACARPPGPLLRIGTNVWSGYAPLYLARDRGLFPPSVRLVEYGSSTEVLRGMRNGAIDGAAVTLDETLLLASSGVELRVVLVTDESRGADVLLAHPEISSGAMLRGRRVGLEATALGAYVFSRALERLGVPPSEVIAVNMNVSEHVRAYRSGSVDAVVTFEPCATLLIAEGAKPLFDSREIPGEILDVIVVRSAVLTDGAEPLAKALRGWFAALAELERDPDGSSKRLARRHKQTPAQFRASLGGLRFIPLEENRTLLAGPRPALVPAGEKLAQVMNAHRLLRGVVDTGRLPDGRSLPGTAP